jgi:hypothetical protein
LISGASAVLYGVADTRKGQPPTASGFDAGGYKRARR